jgi:hypothetical protein
MSLNRMGLPTAQSDVYFRTSVIFGPTGENTSNLVEADGSIRVLSLGVWVRRQ